MIVKFITIVVCIIFVSCCQQLARGISYTLQQPMFKLQKLNMMNAKHEY